VEEIKEEGNKKWRRKEGSGFLWINFKEKSMPTESFTYHIRVS